MNRTVKRGNRVFRKTMKQVDRYLPGDQTATPSPYRYAPDGSLAEADLTTGRIGTTQPLMKSLASKKVHRRKMAQQTVIHEAAHLAQNDEATYLNENLLEGGAEAFARRVGKKELGLTAKDQRPMAYSGATAKLRKRRGMDWVMKDQFR